MPFYLVEKTVNSQDLLLSQTRFLVPDFTQTTKNKKKKKKKRDHLTRKKRLQVKRQKKLKPAPPHEVMCLREGKSLRQIIIERRMRSDGKAIPITVTAGTLK